MRATIPHRRFFTVGRSIALASFAALVVAAAPAAADGVSGLAERLSTLRGEVEALSASLARKDSEIRDQLKALSRQKTELELELKREQTRIQKVHLSIKERRDRISAEEGHDAELAPLFASSLEDVRAYVRGSLPFRIEERLAELEKLESQHKGGVLSASKATSRLWTFVEDEFRLTRESGLYKQPVEVDGKEHLAEVIRIGMVMLYFKVDDRFVGSAKRDGDKWTFATIEDTEQRKLVLNLFESFKKQIRVGLFQVPANLPAPVESTIKPAPKKAAAAAETKKEEPAAEEKTDEASDKADKKAEEAAAAPTAPGAKPKDKPSPATDGAAEEAKQ